MKSFYKKGDFWLYEGDARDMDLIDSDSVDLICTSIPYYNARPEYAEWPSYGSYLSDMIRVWQECHRVLKVGGRIAVNVPLGYGRSEYIPIGVDITNHLRSHFTLRGHIIWNKGGMGSTAWGSWLSASNPSIRDIHEIIILAHKEIPNHAGKGNTIDSNTFLAATQSIWNIHPVSKSWHPAPWPIEIPRRLIELLTFKGDVILDPFAGSCTTLWAAINSGRIGIGIDKNPDYLHKSIGFLSMIENESDWEKFEAVNG